MQNKLFLLLLNLVLTAAMPLFAQHFEASASVSGNNIIFKIKPVDGNITCGWSDVEFFLRNPTASAIPDFGTATITVNTVDFPGVTIPYNGMNLQGSEQGYNNYWFGVSFVATTTRTYNQNQEYTVCTITLGTSPLSFGLELVHNESFVPTYLALTDQGGNDKSSLSGIKFYGPNAVICSCPMTNPVLNHVLPLSGAAPVELLDFRAYKTGKTEAQLRWSTALEFNFEQFVVERRQHKDWTALGAVVARGSADHGAEYEFYDRQAPAGEVYYRLRLLDRDGQEDYSPQRNLFFGQTAEVALQPNISTPQGTLYLHFGLEFAEQSCTVSVCDMKGRVLWTQDIEAAAALKREIPLSGLQLSCGQYQLHLVSESGLALHFSFILATP